MFAKAFRLFVSSTFQDFVEERRLLQEQVFPALEAHCAAQGFGFRAVDMRWGVNDDAQLNQRTAEICLGEVIEAKGYPAPNLLILLGDRYGWVPLPFAIARDEFEAVRDWLSAQGQSDAVVDLGRVYAAAPDDNHLVPGGMTSAGADLTGAYTLHSREDKLSEFHAQQAWLPVETRLRAALQTAARHLHANGQLRDAELGKYTLSLTEQEIRKGLDQLVAGDGAAAANSIAWVRTTEASEPPVRTLADAVQRALPEGHALLADVPVEHGGYNQGFVDRVTAKLIAAIDAQIAEFEVRSQAPDFALRTERAIHDAFAAERLRVFVGRASNLAAIAAHIASEARHPLVLTGISGSGKTALMARAAADANGPVVQRFVGASAASANQRNLLISVIEDLAALGVASTPEQWEDDENRFVNQVCDLLSGLDQPVAIFIDALDQLRAPYRSMWLPPQLHPNVKLIVSVLDDEAFGAERGIVQGLRRSLPAEAFLTIEQLREKDGADILTGLQHEALRGLSPDQQVFILERFRAAGASPLYLRIAFAIARRWRSTDDPRARGLAEDVNALIGQFLDELSSVYHHEPLLVRRALGLIAAGREGLSESEAIAVLSRDAEVMAAVSSERFGARTARLPDSVWVRLKRSVSALLVEKGVEGEPLVSFFHRQVAEVARARLYELEKTALHGALAEYFDPPAENSETDPPWSRRGFIELPFQLFHAQQRRRLEAILADPAWIDRKISAFGGTREIVADYERFAEPDGSLQTLIGRTIRLASGVISRDLRQRISQIHGRLLNGAGPSFLDALLERVQQNGIYETLPALTPPGAELARLDGHTGWVDVLAVLPDGCLVSGAHGETVLRLWDPGDGRELARLEGHHDRIHALAVLPDGHLASGSSDKTIRVWNPTSCREVACLNGHRDAVTTLAVLPDGRLVSGSKDKTIRLWDAASGRELACFGGDLVDALAILPDGRLATASSATIALRSQEDGRELVRLKNDGLFVGAIAALPNGWLASSLADNTIRLWDPVGLPELARLEGHSRSARALAALPDGRLASASSDGTIRLWNPEGGRELACFGGHGDEVLALAVLPNGRLASGSRDRTIRIWDLAKGREFNRFEGPVRALAALPDGRVVSGSGGLVHGGSSNNNAIRLWDSTTGLEVARLEGHAAQINALAALPDGRLASASRDNTIRVWDIAGGRELVRLEGNFFDLGDGAAALAVLPGGRLAGSWSDGAIGLWDPATGRELGRLEGHVFEVTSLAVLPDGRLASGCKDAIRLWDPESGRELARLEGCDSPVRALAVLPDGRIGSFSDDGIRLWDHANGQEFSRFASRHVGAQERHSLWSNALAVLPDGRLASGSYDGIRLWDPSSGRELARFEIDSYVGALLALPDGRLVAGDSFGQLHWLAIKRSAFETPTRLA